MKFGDAQTLSEKNDGLLITLYHFAALAIQAGAQTMQFKHSIVRDDTLYLKRDTGYLAINPSGTGTSQKLFYTTTNFILRAHCFQSESMRSKKLSAVSKSDSLQQAYEQIIFNTICWYNISCNLKSTG